MTTRSALRRHSPFVPRQRRDPFAEAARLTPARRRRLGAVALAIPPVLFLTACTSEEPQPLAVKVTRASVMSTVTATGSLQSISEQKLGFPNAGKLVELNVAVGQHVEPGQVLARLNDFEARQELGTARAQIAQEQAALARVRDGNEVGAADDDAKQADEVLKATKDQAKALDKANASAVEQAERQLDLDKETLEATEDRACGDSDDRDSAEREDEGDCEREAEVEGAERLVQASEAALDEAKETRRAEKAQQELAI